MAAGRDGVGVDEVDGYLWTGIIKQPGCGVDVQRRANDNQDVGLLHGLGGYCNVGHGLAKEDDERSQQGAVASFGAWSNLAVVGCQCLLVARIVDVATGADLHQFAVKMDDLRRAGLLMKVVDILGDDGHVVFLFQRCHEPVAVVGLHTPALPA